MDIEHLISTASNIGKGITEIRDKHYEERKQKKENFNFFAAIVSGKNDKQHIEKYHSNFIAYLLNSEASHDFGNLFLQYFFELLKNPPFNVNKLPIELPLTVEREKLTNEGRFIDISLEVGKEWIIFIENKVWSEEGTDQMKDYCEFANNKYANKVGIYLTLKGESPVSINPISNSGIRVICLSYKDIIKWLKSCCQDVEVNKHPHILSALKQYITVIENILHTMKEDTEAIIEYLKSNEVSTELILTNRRILNDAIWLLTKEIRDKFLADLTNAVDIKIEEAQSIPSLIKVRIHQGDYLFSGDEDKSFGLGFQILKNNELFSYEGGGYGGSGNGIKINGKYAHCEDDIDRGNAELLRTYKYETEWSRLVSSTADEIIREIIVNVIPKLEAL